MIFIMMKRTKILLVSFGSSKAFLRCFFPEIKEFAIEMNTYSRALNCIRLYHHFPKEEAKNHISLRNLER